jgi:hypothetical protein
MPCYEPTGPEIDLAYARSDIDRLEKLLGLACRTLIHYNGEQVLQDDSDLMNWWYQNKNKEGIKLAKEERRKIAHAALNKPFIDLSLEEKKAMREFGYL